MRWVTNTSLDWTLCSSPQCKRSHHSQVQAAICGERKVSHQKSRHERFLLYRTGELGSVGERLPLKFSDAVVALGRALEQAWGPQHPSGIGRQAAFCVTRPAAQSMRTGFSWGGVWVSPSVEKRQCLLTDGASCSTASKHHLCDQRGLPAAAPR